MSDQILGLHHITAIASNAQLNFEFYTKVLGLRLVKKTVNFDDPGTYHLYYGNEVGAPGTILTFFPWEGIGAGTPGVGQVTEIDYAVPEGSLEFWKERFTQFNVSMGEIKEKFGAAYLPFTDPDGLKINFIVPNKKDERKAWETAAIKKVYANNGFNGITLSLKHIDPTAKILTDIFGYRLLAQEGRNYRFVTAAVENAAIVDLLEIPDGKPGLNAAGTNHHVAFRVADETIQMNFREKILSKGLQITGKIDRDYFYSLYFREPGGVLFEIATDNPGFTADEPLASLGQQLKLPKQYESMRARIEKGLPALK